MSVAPSSRKVLLVDADVDALGRLASALRARGLIVFNASEAFDAVEQAFQKRPEVVIATRAIEGANDLADAFRAVPEIADTPILFLTDGEPRAADEVPRANLDLVVSRVTDLSRRDTQTPLPQELRGDLQQMPLVDLVQMLSMNRRSGVLAVVGATGAGEVRLDGGEVIDAIHRRVEGEKAFYRLLGEREGRFAFTSTDTHPPRRLQQPTSMLLMEGMRQVDETKRRRNELSPAGEALLFDEVSHAGTPPMGLPMIAGPHAALARELLQVLQIPRSLDELLDELPATDLAILEALSGLFSAGRLRRIPLSEVMTPLATPEQMPVLRSLVTRLTRPGFAPPPRLVIAASAKRMPALAHAIRRISHAVAPADAPPRAALPRSLGTLRLGEGVELSLIGLPGDTVFAPTWLLALPGAAAVVRLAEAGGAVLEAGCEACEVTLLEAESVIGTIDAAVPAQVAALVRAALELAAGV
jgi:CheY-like chemotaxis protein